MKTKILSLAIFGALGTQVSLAQTKLEEVVVTASKIETPLRQVGASVSLITRDEIELRGYNTVTELLTTLPGISATNAGGAGKSTSLRIRGEEGFRTLVMIDGVDTSDPTGVQVMPHVEHLTSSADIGRIEVLRGPQGFVYGADAGGVVNIFTRTPEQGFEGQVAAEYGRYDSTRLEGYGAAGSERGDVFFSASNQSTNGFNTHVSDESGETDGYENNTFHNKLGLNINEAYRAQLVVRDVSGESSYDNCSPSHNCTADYDQLTARASLSYESEDNDQVVGFAHSDVERAFFSDDMLTYGTEGSISKADYLYSRNMSEAYTLIIGSDFEQEEVLVTNGDKKSRDQLGVFGEAQGSINERWYVTGGLRFDDNEDFGEHVSGRATTAYIVDLDGGNTIKLRSSLGNGFRAPSLSEIIHNASEYASEVAANTALKEELTRGIDAGIEYHGANGLFGELTFFHQEIRDEIFYDFGESGYLQGETKSDSRGIEIAFEYPALSYLVLTGNLTYNKTEDGDGFQRVRRPEKSGNLGAQLSLLDSRLQVLMNVRVVRDSRSFTYTGQALDDYEVIDVSANYEWIPNLTIHARIENAADENYQEIADYNTAGAAAYAGVRYAF